MSVSKTTVSDESQQPVRKSLTGSDKRKRVSSEAGEKATTTTPKKTRKRLNKNAKDKPMETSGKYDFFGVIHHAYKV